MLRTKKPHNSQKAETTLVSIDGWINKMWYIHIMEYYLALKKEIWTHATTWMNLEDIMLSEISQA